MDEGTDCDDFGRTQQMSVSQLLSSTRRLLFVVMYFWQNIFLFQCEQHSRRPTERNKCLSALVVSFLTTADSSFLALIFQTNRNARQITAQPRGVFDGMDWHGSNKVRWVDQQPNERMGHRIIGRWLTRQTNRMPPWRCVASLLPSAARRFCAPHHHSSFARIVILFIYSQLIFWPKYQ